ncbi:MAG TPA: hypothetical protein DCX03_04025 [Bacteroidales bacterium]|nr:hypothetical protein [Bacteroidales bacterium]
MCSLTGRGQEFFVSAGYKIQPVLHYGFILPHHPEMKVFTNHHITGLEVSFLKSSNGEKEWQRTFNYPVMGLSYFYSQLGNTGILGSVHAIYPCIDFPLISSRSTLLALRLGAGLGWFTKTFHRIDNYKNVAIGSHLNAALCSELSVQFGLSSYLSLKMGASFIHFSNGAVKVPNYGINFPALHIGFEGTFKKIPIIPVVHQAQSVNFQPHIRIALSGAIKEIFPVGGQQYNVLNLSLNGITPVSRYFISGLGMDITWDQSDKELLARQGVYISNEAEIINYGVNLFGGLRIGKLDLCLHAGTYIYRKEKSDNIIYDKIVASYTIFENWQLYLTLKTHFAKADYFAAGLGYQF